MARGRGKLEPKQTGASRSKDLVIVEANFFVLYLFKWPGPRLL